MKKFSIILVCMCGIFSFLSMSVDNAYAAREWWPFNKKVSVPKTIEPIEPKEIQTPEPEIEEIEKGAIPVPTAAIPVQVSVPAPVVQVADPVQVTPENLEITDMTNDEIAARLTEIFQYHSNIPAGIQGMETKKGEDGTVSYEFNGIPLNALDKLTLSNLLRNANNQLSLENIDRTQKQLQALKRLDDMNKVTKTQQQLRNLQRINDLTRTQQNLRRPVSAVPNIPKTYSPPKIPKTYKAPTTYKPPSRY